MASGNRPKEQPSNSISYKRGYIYAQFSCSSIRFSQFSVLQKRREFPHPPASAPFHLTFSFFFFSRVPVVQLSVIVNLQQAVKVKWKPSPAAQTYENPVAAPDADCDSIHSRDCARWNAKPSLAFLSLFAYLAVNNAFLFLSCSIMLSSLLRFPVPYHFLARPIPRVVEVGLNKLSPH
jgi:hypothetical protein